MAGIFITAYSFVAAVIGAGFASGQEIFSFFTVYGKWGAAGIVLSALIFGGFAFFVTNTCRKEGLYDYNTLLSRVMGDGMTAVSKLLTLVFLICSLAVMTSCFSEMMYLLFDTNKLLTSLIFIMVCMGIVCTGADRALKLNGILGIITAVGITGAVMYLLRYREHQTFAPRVSALISGAGYSGYNLIGAGVLLARMSGNVRTRKDAAMIGAVSASALFAMMGLIYLLLSIYYKYINLGEIPMLTLAMRENKTITYFYGIMLVMAVVTTAVSDGVGILELTDVRGTKRYISAAAVGMIGLLISGAGFSTVINTAYRICGYAGIALIIYTIIKIKKYEKRK